jgi:23S rRNA pseudouridine1911/1915/1917 synthase
MIHATMQDNPLQTLIIPELYANERLDQVLAKLLPLYSRMQIKEWIDAGKVLVNGKTCKPKVKVKGGETVILEPQFKVQPAWLAQPIPLSIVYEDEALMIINKPAGLVVHPGAGNQDKTLLNALLYHCPDLGQLPRAGILHRLDKNTSGLLLIAKTPAALKHLSQQLKKRTLAREYQATVYGRIISGGTINAPIGRHPLERKRMAINEQGKAAITHYRVLEKFRNHTQLWLKLETGRTHQIRVHMAHIHHSIVGDSQYGGRVQLSKGMGPELIQVLRDLKRQALHAFALGFAHPLTEEWMRFEVKLPEDLQTLLEWLKADKQSS